MWSQPAADTLCAVLCGVWASRRRVSARRRHVARRWRGEQAGDGWREDSRWMESAAVEWSGEQPTACAQHQHSSHRSHSHSLTRPSNFRLHRRSTRTTLHHTRNGTGEPSAPLYHPHTTTTSAGLAGLFNSDELLPAAFAFSFLRSAGRFPLLHRLQLHSLQLLCLPSLPVT